MARILLRRVAIECSSDEDEHENDGYATDNEWDKDEDEYQRNLNLQQDSTKRSESPDSRESGWSDESEQEEVGLKQKMPIKHRKKSTPSNLQSDHRERSESPDSGHGSDNNEKSGTTSPSYSMPKAKPPLSPKPKNKLAAAQVNNDPVNSEVQNSPITETPVGTKEQNSSGQAEQNGYAENESKELAARIEREQAKRSEEQERQKKVNSEIQEPSALPFKEKIKRFCEGALRY